MFGLKEARFQKAAAELDMQPYRLEQIRNWIYRRYVSDFHQMDNLPLTLRESLNQRYRVTGSQVVAFRRARGATKLLVQLADGLKIETVLLRYRDWTSACLSTQVGCAMGCSFCATAPQGFERNLTAEEMAEQLWHCGRFAAENKLPPVRNAVLMGIGEPLANFSNVVQFIHLANDPRLFNMGQRRLTLSTVGLISQIQELAALKLAITLAVSLHAPNDKLRNQLMPITKKYPVQDIVAACRNYTEATGRRVTYEYILLAAVNDQDSHGVELVRLLKGQNCLVNLIPYNPVPDAPFQASPRVAAFQQLLKRGGLNVSIRRSLGPEIDGACGQLRKRLTDV